MPRGDKSRYTDKQKRKARHIEEGYRARGTSPKVAAARAWATVNAESGGAEKPGGSGYGKPENHRASRRGGKIAMARRSTAARSSAAKKAAATRKRKATLTRRKRSVAAKKAVAKRKPARRTSTRQSRTR